MYYQQTIDHCFPLKILSTSFDKNYHKLMQDVSIDKLLALPLVAHCMQDNDLPKLQQVAIKIKEQFSHIVVLGTGGSTLCPQTFSALEASPEPKLYYADYIDPIEMNHLQQTLPWSNTCFIAISKSGRTLETLTQVLWSLGQLKKTGISEHRIGQHFIIITDPGSNPLRTIATDIGATILDHEAEIGGRYAAFTNVGLLPAMIAGLDPYEFRRGGQTVIKNMEACYVGAALATTYFAHQMNTTVFMPYISKLKPLSTLFRQLWAESLGKEGKGGTPLIALGTLDQHSQLQLYLDGPKDKWFTILTLNTHQHGELLPSHVACDYLANHTIGDVQQASQQATVDTLIQHQCPVRLLHLQKLDAPTLGALAMHVMLETILTAKLLNVNPFDQPAVEDGKRRARTLLASIK